MTPRLERSSSCNTMRGCQQQVLETLLHTKAGSLKRRFTWDEKLRILDLSSPKEATEERLQDFADLFSYRYTEGIITQVGQGPRAWTKLRGAIAPWYIARHLLADRIPTLPPQWVGARSFPTTRFFAIDVDADRSPEQMLADKYDIANMDDDDRAFLLNQARPRKAKAKLPFEDRCRYVEEVLRWVGIDPEDPLQVLIQPTPSGGRHYYVFLDAPYYLDQLRWVLDSIGFKHSPGEVEFFPSTGRGLRLPFGHVPGQPHDPTAWIKFIDNYRSRRIRRFSIQEMYDAIDRHRHVADSPLKQPTRQTKTIYVNVQGQRPLHGIPKRERQAIERYQQLVHDGPKSMQEAQELFDLGILLPSTRNTILNHLAANLIWFKGLAADEATEQLATWAYDWRHDSKDIRDDLQNGTRKVAKQIAAMCAWYAERKKPESHTNADRPLFAQAELISLRAHLQTLPPEDRTKQVHFLLSFLRFAKLHGKPAENGAGWEAAPAINAVVKQWEGCRHGNSYRKRLDHAEAAGILTMIREKWQNPRGQGRARTYRLAVPIVSREEWGVDYNAALEFLTQECPAEMQQAGQGENEQLISPTSNERSDVNDEQPNRDSTSANAARSDHPTPVRPACPGTHLEPGSRERPEKPDAAVGIPHSADGAVRGIPAAAAGQACPPGGKSPAAVMTPRATLFVDEEMLKRREETQAAIRELLDDPTLPPSLRRVLTADPEQLTDAEVKARITLVFQQRKKRVEKTSSGPPRSLPTCMLPKRYRLEMQVAERRRQLQPRSEADTLVGAR